MLYDLHKIHSTGLFKIIDSILLFLCLIILVYTNYCSDPNTSCLLFIIGKIKDVSGVVIWDFFTIVRFVSILLCIVNMCVINFLIEIQDSIDIITILLCFLGCILIFVDKKFGIINFLNKLFSIALTDNDIITKILSSVIFVLLIFLISYQCTVFFDIDVF